MHSWGVLTLLSWNYKLTFVEWTMTRSPVSIAECPAPVGPPAVVSSHDPLEMFFHFFSGELIDRLVRETNRYAAQMRAATSSPWETNATKI